MAEPRCEYPNCGGECIGCVNGQPERRKGERRGECPREYWLLSDKPLRRMNERRGRYLVKKAKP